MSSYFTSPTAPNLFPYFSIGLFGFSHAFLSTRFVKVALKMDNNVCPRLDLDKYGKAAVEKGKITQAQLDQLHRRQAAHENAIENLPYFLVAMVFAHHAGLPNATINKLCLAYSIIRVFYAWAYLTITTREASFLRSLAWWSGNIVCFMTFIKSGRALSAGRW